MLLISLERVEGGWLKFVLNQDIDNIS